MISIDIPAATLELVGLAGERRPAAEIDTRLAERAAAWPGYRSRHEGVLGLFTRSAGPTAAGASML